MTRSQKVKARKRLVECNRGLTRGLSVVDQLNCHRPYDESLSPILASALHEARRVVELAIKELNPDA